MGTIIIYSSKNGFTQQCALELASKIDGGAKVCNINKDKVPAIDDYDTVVLGSAIYSGSMGRKIKQFAKSNLSALLKKKIFIFVTCYDDDRSIIEKNLPASLCKQALYKDTLGGKMIYKSLNIVEKIMLKAGGKTDDLIIIKESAIEELSERINRVAE